MEIEEGEPTSSSMILKFNNCNSVFLFDTCALRANRVPLRGKITEIRQFAASLHIDRHFAENTQWGQPLVNSLFTLGLVIGITVGETTLGTTIGNLGMTNTTFPNPVFQGDTIHVTTEVAAVRASKSKPDRGIVDFIHRGYNQDDVLVCECHRQAMMWREKQ